jgi:hypothetical protein
MELIVISSEGIVIRTRMDSIRPMGRATQGVSVINVAPGDSVAALATIDMDTGANGGPANSGPKAPEAKQPPLTGIDAPPAKDVTPGPARRPTPIRGSARAAKRRPAPAPRPAAKKQRPAPKKSSPARSKAQPAPRPRAKQRPRTVPKGKPKSKRR